MKVEKKQCGVVDGKPIMLFTITNDHNTQVSITNAGSTITSIRTADRNGKMDEIVLGFDDPMMYLSPEYRANNFFFGATVGRFANRIAEGRFAIDSKTYELEVNCGPNTLHGGTDSFHTKVWDADTFESDAIAGVKMHYVSAHMENGYPGELDVNVVFSLNQQNELKISYQAKTDKKTVINLTNHSYFNLRSGGDVLGTRVLMQASQYTPMDETNIPTGEIESVKDTPLDFTVERKIGDRVHMLDDGYDHNYVVNGVQGELRLAAEAYDEETGRTLTFFTTEPGFQFYSSHYLDGSFERNGFRFDQYCGFCFEAQHYPDSPNKPQFPTSLLKPGETYTQTTVYRFGTK